MLLERVDQNCIRHLDAIVQGDQIRIVALEFLRGHGAESAVEVVN